jgi:hypothetical protein
METGNDSIRDRLLSHLPHPANLADYREEVDAMLGKNEKVLRRETWVVTALWLFMVALSTAFLLLGGLRSGTPLGLYFEILACFVLIYPAVELLKHFINRSRVELLKEVKQLQLQVLELQAFLRKSGDQ